MDKSQLRKLAADYARGRISRAEYRERRADLIDGVVRGEIAIERTPPPPPPASKPTPASPVRSGPRIAPSAGLKPAFPVFVVLSVVLVAILTWAVIPSKRPAVAPRSAPGAFQTFVEGFLGSPDWSEAGITEFEAAWKQLTGKERLEARSAAWFRRVATALDQELNAQEALAEIDANGRAARAMARLTDFAITLGLREDKVSALPKAVQHAKTSAPSGPMTSDRQDPVPRRSSATPNETARAGSHDHLPGNHWITLQDETAYTLQLFAVNGLDEVERLISVHPELQLKVLFYDRDNPRYRVIYGIYASSEEASEALREIPLAMLRQAPKPLVKSVLELLANLSPIAPSVQSANVAKKAADTGGEGKEYTLQLFAMNDEENVQKLLAMYPELRLQVRRSAESGSPYRVLYGAFASSYEAERAFYALPDAIVGDALKPVVKPWAQFARQP